MNARFFPLRVVLVGFVPNGLENRRMKLANWFHSLAYWRSRVVCQKNRYIIYMYILNYNRHSTCTIHHHKYYTFFNFYTNFQSSTMVSAQGSTMKKLGNLVRVTN